MNGCMDACMDAWMDGWMDGWIDTIDLMRELNFSSIT